MPEGRRQSRRAGRRKRLIYVAVAVVMVGCFGAAAWQVQKKQASRSVTAGNPKDMGVGYRQVKYQGEKYRYNELITTILYAGVDSTGIMTENADWASAARADSIAVAVLDKKKGKMTVIALNRDIMTEVHRYSMSGRDRGTYETHLGYAYSYGDGGKVSCENLQEAVEGILGVPVGEYIITNQDSMTYINDFVGGVTVTMPNNDLVKKYPDMKEGVQVTLDDTNIQDYLQYRDTTKDLSNEGRIQRQKSYITSYVQQLKTRLDADLYGSWDDLQDMEDYLQTSITRNKYLRLGSLLEKITFTESDYYIPQGEYVVGEDHDEFYLDEEALREKVIELFYEKIG